MSDMLESVCHQYVSHVVSRSCRKPSQSRARVSRFEASSIEKVGRRHHDTLNCTSTPSVQLSTHLCLDILSTTYTAMFSTTRQATALALRGTPPSLTHWPNGLIQDNETDSTL